MGCLLRDFLQRPSSWLRLISEVGGTYTAGPNFAFDYCLREDKLPASELAGIDLSSLDAVLVGAEPVRANTFTRFRERFAAYGLQARGAVHRLRLGRIHPVRVHSGAPDPDAEQASACSKNRVRVEKALPENNNQVRLVSCGKPLDGNVLRIVDPQSGQALGESRIGEIWLDGASKGGGYWRRPEVTAQTFGARIAGDDDHTYLRTGDLGFLHEGELFVLRPQQGPDHRPRRQLLPPGHRGRRGALGPTGPPRLHRRVLGRARRAGSTGRRRRSQDEHALPDAKALARAIRRHCQIDPHTIVFVPPRSVPKTTSGKIRRAETRTLWLEGKLPELAAYTHQTHDGPGASAGPLERFRHFIESYDLTGQEDYSFARSRHRLAGPGRAPRGPAGLAGRAWRGRAGRGRSTRGCSSA